MRFLYSLFLLASSVVGAELEWTLPKAAKQVLKSNSQILKKKQFIKEKEAEKLEVFSVLLPRIKYNYSWYRNKATLSLGLPLFDGEAYNTYHSRFDIIQPIISGGALWSAPQLSSELLNQANLDLKITERSKLIELGSRYSKILLLQAQVNTFARQLKTQERLVMQAKKMFKSGTERKLSLYRFQAQAASIKPKLISAQNNLENEAISLLNFMNVGTASQIRFSGALDKLSKLKIEDLKNKSPQRTLEEKLIRSELKAFEKSKAVEMSEHWPQLSLIGSWGTRSNTKAAVFSDLSREWTYGVELSIPLFSGLSSVAKRRKLAANKARLTIDKKQLDKDVLMGKTQARKNYDSSIKMLAASQDSYRLSKLAYEEATQRFKLGTLKYAEFFDVEKEFIDSELTNQKAMQDHFLRILDYCAALGTDLKPVFL